MTSPLKNLIFSFLLTAVLSFPVYSQNNQNNLSGRVSDASGAGVSGAEIVLKRQDVRFERVTVSDASGNFQFSNLTPGSYVITASAKNFGAVTRIVSLNSNQPIEINLSPQAITEEVLVNAASLAGTPESLSEIPGTIERIDAQMLENSRVFNFSEALRKVSGVNVRDEEGFGLRPNIGIRGTNPTRSTKVLLLEDGIPLSYAPYGDNASYYHPPVDRYESIEVLKGSGQIAYGPVTVAGVVNYLTPNPPDKPEFDFLLEGGNRRFFKGGAGFGGTFGKFGVLANFTHKRGEGARENLFSELNDFSSKLTYSINDRNALTGKFSAYREDSNVTYSGLTEAEFRANPRGNIFKNDFFYGRRYGGAVQHVGVFTPRVNLTTNFYAAYFSRDWWRQSSNSSQRPNRLNVDPECRSLADLNTTCGNEGRLRNYINVGFEPRLNAIFDTGSVRNEFTGGVRVHWEKQKRRQENGDLPNSRTGALAEFNYRRNLAISAFAQNRFVFGDFAVTPGIRVEKINYERENRLTTPTFSGAIGETDITEAIPGIGIAYSGIKNTTVFAGVHRGFAPPRTEDIITNAGGVVELDAERSWNYEVGVRTRPARGVSIESAFFRNDYENQIVAASIAGGTGAALTNGGETLHQGFEFVSQIDTGAIFRSPHNVYFRAAYTWLPIAEFRGIRFSSVTPTVSVSGNRLPYAPENLLTASVGYSHPIGFDAFIENVYVGRQFGDDLNTINPTANGQRGAIQAQTYWNATANYKVEKWRTTFFVTAKNIFDRTFIVDRTRGILPSSPRLIQGGVKVHF
jgi:Fe(3+) dicitrate transport protein